MMQSVMNRLSGVIDTPTSTDILCGKDKTYSQHPGNLFYRQLIEQHAAGYSLAASKQDKIKITRMVLADLQGRRFLQPDRNHKGRWVVVPQQKVRDKCSHALRFYCNQHADSLRRNEQRERFMQRQEEEVDDDMCDNGDDAMDTLRSQDIREIMRSTEQFDTLRSEDMGEILCLSSRRQQDEDCDMVLS